MIRTESFRGIGAKFGVSDKTITKWCKSYGLPNTKREIKTYSDKDWELI